MLDFDRSNPGAFNQDAQKKFLPFIHSYEVWEANEEKIVLRVVIGNVSLSTSTKTVLTTLLLVRWVGDDLEVVAQRDAPRKEAPSW